MKPFGCQFCAALGVWSLLIAAEPVHLTSRPCTAPFGIPSAGRYAALAAD